MLRSLAFVLMVTMCGCGWPRDGRAEEAESEDARIRLQRGSVDVDGLTRRYLIHVPENLLGGEGAPLVVMFHGGGGTARAAATQSQWHHKAEREGFIAVFPEGTGRDPEAPGNFLRNPQIWYDGSGRFTASRERAYDDVAFIDRLLDELSTSYPIDPTRIYATGFSNGASMTFRIGVELSGRFAAVAPVAGTFWLEAAQPERPVPLLYITGEEDTLNALDGGIPTTLTGREMGKAKPPVIDSIERWAEMIGCPQEPVSIDAPEGVTAVRYGPCADGAEVRFYTVADCGHTWPGGRSLLPERVVGPRTDRLDATDLIWEFFCEQRL